MEKNMQILRTGVILIIGTFCTTSGTQLPFYYSVLLCFKPDNIPTMSVKHTPVTVFISVFCKTEKKSFFCFLPCHWAHQTKLALSELVAMFPGLPLYVTDTRLPATNASFHFVHTRWLRTESPLLFSFGNGHGWNNGGLNFKLSN